jgi:Ala-tRNA(Pro) deacylase
MAIATTLEQYLANQRIAYDLLSHAPTLSSMSTAQASHVPGACLAKAVVVKQGEGYLIAVIPASCHLHLDDLERLLNCEVELATEQDIETAFPDCARGAVPPIGAAYGISMIVDESIGGQPEIYFEGGDHATLVHMSGPEFARLTAGMPHAQFSHHH